MYCKFCGQKLPDGSRFCGRCGRPTEGPVSMGSARAPRPALTGYAGMWPALIAGLAIAAFLLYLMSAVTVESFVGEQTYHLVFSDSWPPILRESSEKAEAFKTFTLPVIAVMLAMVIAGAVKRQKPYCFWGSLMGLYAFTAVVMMVTGPLQEEKGLYEVKGQPMAMTLSILAFLALLILSIFSPRGIRPLSRGWLLPTAVFAAVTAVFGQISGSAYSGGSPMFLHSIRTERARLSAMPAGGPFPYLVIPRCS
ncbi:zinc ribbon domain-containing protein [bacterium 1xD42-67]|nr:zinc ribbon domain-containing protein [bacterium 1xD42-67]